MPGVKIQIVRFVDDYQPGIVECQLIDAHGRTWSFVEKIPIVTAEDIWRESAYPRPAVVDCVIIARIRDDSGREIVQIDTDKPWGVESVEGNTRFEVLPDAIVTEV